MTRKGARLRNKGSEVVVCYSHRDIEWLERLHTHLQPAIREFGFSAWDDRRIRAGDDWRKEIAARLASASVAVLLVSPNFLASDFIMSNELPPLLKAARRGDMRVLCIHVSASFYEVTEIARYQAAHDPARPLDSLRPPERNRLMVQLCRTIAEFLGEADA